MLSEISINVICAGGRAKAMLNRKAYLSSLCSRKVWKWLKDLASYDLRAIHSLFQTKSYQLPSRGESVFTKTGGLNQP